MLKHLRSYKDKNILRSLIIKDSTWLPLGKQTKMELYVPFGKKKDKNKVILEKNNLLSLQNSRFLLYLFNKY